jgi:hypothetical protein
LSGLFREEAIRRYLDRGGRGEIARLTPGWVGATFWLVVAASLIGIAFLAFATVDEYAAGPAVVRAGRVEAYLPGAYAARLTPGLPLVVRLDGAREALRVSVETVGPSVLSPEEARARLGVASGDRVIEGACVVVSGTVPAVIDGGRGRAEVAVATRRLGEALLR